MTEFHPVSGLLLLVCGFLIGGVAALLGVGGGLLQVPLIYHLLTMLHDRSAGLAMREAVATSLGVMVFTSAAAAFGHWQRGNYLKEGAAPLVLAGCLGAALGGNVALGVSADWIRIAFGAATIVLSIRMAFGAAGTALKEGKKPAFHGPAAYAGGGAAAGLVSAALGIGGGVVLVPFLTAGMGHSTHRSTGTSSLFIVLVSFVGAGLYALRGGGGSGGLGFVQPWFVLCMAPGSMAGAYLGARWLQPKIGDLQLRRYFAVLLVFVGVKMAFF